MGKGRIKTRCRACGLVGPHDVRELDGKNVLERACVRCVGRVPRARCLWRDEQRRAAE